jgi:hypothetical protein
MLDQLNSLQNLAKFDVVLTGNWVLSPSAQWKWSGEAIAETPLVGIVFLSCGNRMYWAKSGASYAKVAPQVYESQPVSSKLPVELFLHDTFNRNVQFMYSIGLRDGIHDATAMLSKDYLPQIPHTRTIQTGQLFTFASIDSTPMTTLYAMFLAKQDVKMKRKHIWRLRKPLLERLTSPLLEVFTFGRFGKLAI